MLNIALSSVAKSALVGAVATKLVDTFLTNRLHNDIEQKKWIRNTKFELFSKLTEEILTMTEENKEENINEIKKTCAKITLLINDKRLLTTIERYLAILVKYKNQKVGFESLDAANKKMINYLKNNLR